MTNYQALYEFIDRATKSRKYPEATAQTLRAALKVYDSELNDDERAAIAKFKENFEQITRSVFTKNSTKFTASSLTTYKSRVQKVLADYDKYGDPTKMNSWSPKVIMRPKRSVGRVISPSGFVTRDEQTNSSAVPIGQSYPYADAGMGWSIAIRSGQPLNSDIKKALVDIADSLQKLNKESE